MLVADIGGTSSRFALASSAAGGQLLVEEQVTVPTSEAASFSELVGRVAAINPDMHPDACEVSVFAVPGPVSGRQAALANIPWQIDLDQTAFRSSASHLINDFEAQAFGCLANARRDFVAIKHPEREIVSGMVAVGPGTGIGHCGIEITPAGPTSHPAECGRWLLPFVGKDERRYQEFLETRTGLTRLRGDMLLSGGGLALLHEFLTGERLRPHEVAQSIDQDSATTEWFARLLARDCQHYVLACFDFCDVLCLTGGVAVKNPFLTDNEAFREEFVEIDSYRDRLDAIAIRLATTEDLGLVGCAYFGALRLAKH